MLDFILPLAVNTTQLPPQSPLVASTTNPAETVTIEFANQKVQVPKGGYYDRFRMHPDLDEVAKDPKAGNIDFFRNIPKQMEDSRVGKIWAPNFFYRTSNIQVVMLAPIAKLKAKLSMPLEPLQPIPGFGLVALTFFRYEVCDNDPYNEVSVAVVLRPPHVHAIIPQLPQPLQLANAIRQRHMYAHVLALPVNTEIARVRGVYAYQLPKWLTRIDVDINKLNSTATLWDTTGKPDVSISLPTPAFKSIPSQTKLSTHTMLHNIDGQWHQTDVLSNPLSVSQQLFPKNVKLEKHGGKVSQLLEELGVGKIIRVDVTNDAQTVLYLPKPLKNY